MGATNTSGFKGVSRRPSGNYRAEIRIKGRRTHLLTSADPEVCAFAYSLAARVAFGEFAGTA
jgi:hypothetical protein